MVNSKWLIVNCEKIKHQSLKKTLRSLHLCVKYFLSRRDAENAEKILKF